MQKMDRRVGILETILTILSPFLVMAIMVVMVFGYFLLAPWSRE